MAKHLVQDTSLTAIADAIRAKTGGAEPLMFPDGMTEAIAGITGGEDLDAELAAQGELIDQIFTAIDEKSAAISSGGGGGAGLNIAYGDTAPEDTTKLWVKAAEPNVVKVTTGVSLETGTLEKVGELGDTNGLLSLGRVGDNIYMFGGYRSGSGIDEIKKFNINTREVTVLNQKLEYKSRGIATAVIGKKIYLFGGHSAPSNFLSTIYVFDTESETLSKVSAALPKRTLNIATAVVGKNVYLFGGTASTGVTDSVYVFDTESVKLSYAGVLLPTALTGISTIVVGTSVYLFGGSGSAVVKDIYEFNTETNSFTKKQYELPVAATDMACAQFGTKAYLFGGWGESEGLDSIVVVDVETGGYSTLDITLPAKNNGYGAVAVGGAVYVFPSTNVPDGAIYRMTVEAQLPPGTMVLQYAVGDNLFPIVNSDALTIELSPATVHIGDENGAAQPAEAFIYKDGAWTAI